jgi:Toprim domain
MISQAGDLARRLARDAEAVCRHYLSNGRRCGHYWVAGDVMNTPGRSLYVRLHGPEFGPGAAGKWTDAATGEHGDLLDLIGRNRDLHRLGEAMDEARFFLALPRPPERIARAAPAPRRSVYYRESDNAPLELWPALLAAVTGLDGTITGILRTWLDPRRPAKAPLADPRRALGHLLGNGVRFGSATKPAPAQAGVLGAGEGVETVLALNDVLPALPVVAALSANHLAALELPPALRRLYVARDNDAAGLYATKRLHERGGDAGIDVRDLVPVHGDFNLDLCRLGPATMLAHVAPQLDPSDRARFLPR